MKGSDGFRRNVLLSRCELTNATNILFLLFNTPMSCVAVFLTLISSPPRDFETACVLSIFAQHQNSRLADAQSPGWRPRLKSFLRRQTSRAASPIAAILPPPQCRLNRGNWVSLAASSRPLNWSDGSRTVSVSLRASTCFVWIPTILGTTISPHLARRQSAALQVLRLAIEENLWNLRADSAAGAPQVMTRLRWHLLTCSAGLPGLDEVIPLL